MVEGPAGPAATATHSQQQLNARPYILGSLLANLVLTGLLLYRAAELNRPAPTGLRPYSVSRTMTEIDLENVSPPPTPAVRAVAPPFNWRQIESPDYKVFIANLKSVKCPPATIRDIVVADVAEEYTHKRSQILAGIEPEYWNLVAKGEKAVQQSLDSPVEKLGAEKSSLIKELLALIGPTGDPDISVVDPELRSLVDFLDSTKQDKVIALEYRYRALADQLQNYLETDPAGTRTKNKVLMDEKLKELEQILAPSELEEYQLRRSPEAGWARDIRGLVPTDEEFRGVAKLMRDIDAKNPSPAKNDPDAQAKEAQRRSMLDQQMRELLGNQRYLDIKRALDGEYQLLTLIGGRYQMTPDTVKAAFAIKQTSEQQAVRLSQQAALTDEDRQAAIGAIQVEAQRSLQKTMGDGPWQTYQKYGGSWLAYLGK